MASEKGPEAKLIEGHFLFPVVELLSKKCETAMYTLDQSCFDVDDVFQLIEKIDSKTDAARKKAEDKDVNDLVFNIIYMLRVHLMELSKLSRLIEKFRNKYSASLKKTLARNDLHLPAPNSESDDDALSIDEMYGNEALQNNPPNYGMTMAANPYAMMAPMAQMVPGSSNSACYSVPKYDQFPVMNDPQNQFLFQLAYYNQFMYPIPNMTAPVQQTSDSNPRKRKASKLAHSTESLVTPSRKSTPS